MEDNMEHLMWAFMQGNREIMGRGSLLNKTRDNVLCVEARMLLEVGGCQPLSYLRWQRHQPVKCHHSTVGSLCDLCVWKHWPSPPSIKPWYGWSSHWEIDDYRGGGGEER